MAWSSTKLALVERLVRGSDGGGSSASSDVIMNAMGGLDFRSLSISGQIITLW